VKASDHLMLAQLEEACVGFAMLMAEVATGDKQAYLYERATIHQAQADKDREAARKAAERQDR
jgi:hypothetical protein